MDKVLSARVDEAVLRRLNLLARELGASKKSILEKAILQYAETVGAETRIDVLEATSGAWQRDEKPVETVETARRTFRNSMNRHQS